jgi:hypothetical protein
MNRLDKTDRAILRARPMHGLFRTATTWITKTRLARVARLSPALRGYRADRSVHRAAACRSLDGRRHLSSRPRWRGIARFRTSRRPPGDYLLHVRRRITALDGFRATKFANAGRAARTRRPRK